MLPRTLRGFDALLDHGSAAARRAVLACLPRPLDRFTQGLIRHAAARAPETLVLRLEEEWSADLSSQRGQVSRLGFALGCYWAALAIKRAGSTSVPTNTSSAGGQIMSAYARYPQLPPCRRVIHATPAGVVCEINTTPLIDVMLVLLVTLIISLPLMTHAVKLDLPRGPFSSEKSPPEIIDLDIDSDGTVAWNGSAISGLQQLESLFRAEAQKHPQPEIHLRPDRGVRYASVAEVLAAAQRNHMTRIGFVEIGEFKD
jgi:biopolymer transport protein ExbD